MAENVTQWEYTALESKAGGIRTRIEHLNQLGKEGWEATIRDCGGEIILKRPKQQRSQPTYDRSLYE